MASGTKRRTATLLATSPAPADAGGSMLIGYARVSTEDQKLDLQRDQGLRMKSCVGLARGSSAIQPEA